MDMLLMQDEGGLVIQGQERVYFASLSDFERYAACLTSTTDAPLASLSGKTYLCYCPDDKVHIDRAAGLETWQGRVAGYDAIINLAKALWTAKTDPYFGLSETERAAKRLAAAKAAKRQDLQAAFEAAETALVAIGGRSYKGGAASAMAMDSQRRMILEYASLMPELAITTVDFYDALGHPAQLPLKDDAAIDALDVCLAVGSAASACNFKYAALRQRLEMAETVAAVAAVGWV
ncbi:MAG: hypothetical protein LBU39_06915 [Desulfobulbaceae bacterium]|jgi:hypothetical protein|nr:hypothetical protein [Desulfobulbaceae bacterium]